MSEASLLSHQTSESLEFILKSLKSPDATAADFAAARELAQEMNMCAFEFSQNVMFHQFSAAGSEAVEAIESASELEES